MNRGVSNIEVKKFNRNRVFRYVNSREKTSMPDIAAAVGMSGPTVLQMIKELKALRIVEEVGEFESTGGRKAKAIAPVHDACYAVGVNITPNHVSMVLTNLSKKVLKHVRIRKKFVNQDIYFKKISELIESFIQENTISASKVIGIGIAVPGIVDSVHNCILQSHILNVQNITCDKFEQYISRPFVLLNDANAAAMTEYIEGEDFNNMIYLSLSNTVGGAIIFQQRLNLVNASNRYAGIFGSMYLGNHWQSGEFGHMVIRSEGVHCYCGKQGCLDAYCSTLPLETLGNGKLNSFFQELESGNNTYKALWEEYLSNLAIAVDNLRMSFDCDVILGGYAGSFMDPYLQVFQNKVAEKNIFGHIGDYVRVCKYKVEAAALGAASYQIEKYVDSI